MSNAQFLSPAQFATYAQAWEDLLHQPTPEALQQCFTAQTPNKVLWNVTFPIQRIVQLVSVVGGRTIRARFVVLPEPTPRFSLVLYAADAEGKRLSAYYLAERAPAPVGLQDQVPHALVSTWLHNWQKISHVDASLFQTLRGPLKGYNFELADFMDPLFRAQPFTNQELRLYFGLHEYYSADPATEEQQKLTQTFGLVLRIYGATPEEGGTSDAPIYDVSMPCPPTC